jgi:hypothetical protein
MAGELCLSGYELPSIKFVGGETLTLAFHLTTRDGAPYNADDCDVNFAAVGYANRAGPPVVSKPCVVTPDSNGFYSVATVTLERQDTLNLQGKFIYQVSVRNNRDGEIEIPGHGVAVALRNIDKDFG